MMNNMNNNGMNPMNMNFPLINNNAMNPLIMNNNMIGINGNQQNLMDENAIRIKNIIQPYENKIKELEEIIRQKDFEIALLKDRLNNNGNNIQCQMNPMMTNMNNNMMIGNINQIINIKGKEISVFYYNSKYTIFEDEITYKLFEKINDFNWKLVTFKINGNTLNPFISIAENGIKEGSNIEINDCLNITFDGPFGKKTIIIDENFPFKKAVKQFLLRVGRKGKYNSFSFYYNANKISIEDEAPIKQLFQLSKNHPNVIYICKQ